MRRIVFYIVLFLSVAQLRAQDVKVTADFDSSRIYIGDQIHFTITVDQPVGLVTDIPLLKDTIIKNIEIISGPIKDSVPAVNGRIKILEKYIVSSFDSGYYNIKPLYAEIKTSEGLKRFYSDYSRLQVMKYKTAPADSTDKIYDIVGPYKAPITAGEVIPWVLAVIIAAVVIWGIIRFIRSRKRVVKGQEIVINPDPAHVIAFRELEKLLSEELWQKGEMKLYYTRLTEILRQYLENRYGVYSLELTTSETLTALVKTGFKKDESYNKLKSVLTGADLVKFAKYKPEAAENDGHFQNAWEFVQTTKDAAVKVEENKIVIRNEEGRL